MSKMPGLFYYEFFICLLRGIYPPMVECWQASLDGGQTVPV